MNCVTWVLLLAVAIAQLISCVCGDVTVRVETGGEQVVLESKNDYTLEFISLQDFSPRINASIVLLNPDVSCPDCLDACGDFPPLSPDVNASSVVVVFTAETCEHSDAVQAMYAAGYRNSLQLFGVNQRSDPFDQPTRHMVNPFLRIPIVVHRVHGSFSSKILSTVFGCNNPSGSPDQCKPMNNQPNAFVDITYRYSAWRYELSHGLGLVGPTLSLLVYGVLLFRCVQGLCKARRDGDMRIGEVSLRIYILEVLGLTSFVRVADGTITFVRDILGYWVPEFVGLCFWAWGYVLSLLVIAMVATYWAEILKVTFKPVPNLSSSSKFKLVLVFAILFLFLTAAIGLFSFKVVGFEIAFGIAVGSLGLVSIVLSCAILYYGTRVMHKLRSLRRENRTATLSVTATRVLTQELENDKLEKAFQAAATAAEQLKASEQLKTSDEQSKASAVEQLKTFGQKTSDRSSTSTTLEPADLEEGNNETIVPREPSSNRESLRSRESKSKAVTSKYFHRQRPSQLLTSVRISLARTGDEITSQVSRKNAKRQLQRTRKLLAIVTPMTRFVFGIGLSLLVFTGLSVAGVVGPSLKAPLTYIIHYLILSSMEMLSMILVMFTISPFVRGSWNSKGLQRNFTRLKQQGKSFFTSEYSKSRQDNAFYPNHNKRSSWSYDQPSRGGHNTADTQQSYVSGAVGYSTNTLERKTSKKKVLKYRSNTLGSIPSRKTNLDNMEQQTRQRPAHSVEQNSEQNSNISTIGSLQQVGRNSTRVHEEEQGAKPKGFRFSGFIQSWNTSLQHQEEDIQQQQNDN